MERFWSKVEKTDSCWLWRAALDTRGYGQFRLVGRLVLAHRLSYELLVGPVPSGLELDHLCRNRACCNPDHLEPVTHRENVRRGDTGRYLASRTHCPAGHPLSGENLYRPPGRPHRQCRACKNEQKRVKR